MTDRSDETRQSLLLRIRNPHDSTAWQEFHDLYAPLLYGYARARGLDHADAEDVRSACFGAVTQQIDNFDYDQAKGGFKAWLRTIARRRVVDLIRKRRPAAQSNELRAAPADEGSPDEIWEQQWKEQHLRHCVEKVGREVTADVFEAFQMLVREECSVEEVARHMGWNANQVYKAKSNVLARVRRKMAELYSEIDSGR